MFACRSVGRLVGRSTASHARCFENESCACNLYVAFYRFTEIQNKKKKKKYNSSEAHKNRDGETTKTRIMYAIVPFIYIWSRDFRLDSYLDDDGKKKLFCISDMSVSHIHYSSIRLA